MEASRGDGGRGLDATESHTRNGCDGELYLGNISRRSQLPLYRGRLCDMTRLALGSLLSVHQASFHTTEDGRAAFPPHHGRLDAHFRGEMKVQRHQVPYARTHSQPAQSLSRAQGPPPHRAKAVAPSQVRQL